MHTNEIAIGLQMSRHKNVFKFGFQGAVGTTPLPVWDLVEDYPWPIGADQVSVTSDDASDTASGSGARTVRVSGLDILGKLYTEDVTLLGQTVVLTLKEFRRVFRVQVLTAGLTGHNEGTIYVGTGTVTAGVPDVKLAAITPTENQTLMAIYTIPTGYTGLVYNLAATGDSTKTVTIWAKVREPGGVFQTKNKFLITQGQVDFRRVLPGRFIAGSDVMIVAAVDTGTTEVSATFEILLVSDDVRRGVRGQWQ